MPRYIDADALTEHIEHESRMWGDEYDAHQILDDIEDIPTADVKPVVRGKWIKHNEVKVFINGESSTGGVMCSACGYKTHNKAHTQIGCPFNFCPNCGADMRGDRNG